MSRGVSWDHLWQLADADGDLPGCVVDGIWRMESGATGTDSLRGPVSGQRYRSENQSCVCRLPVRGLCDPNGSRQLFFFDVHRFR
jgi:hypothetical protein